MRRLLISLVAVLTTLTVSGCGALGALSDRVDYCSGAPCLQEPAESRKLLGRSLAELPPGWGVWWLGPSFQGHPYATSGPLAGSPNVVSYGPIQVQSQATRDQYGTVSNGQDAYLILTELRHGQQVTVLWNRNAAEVFYGIGDQQSDLDAFRKQVQAALEPVREADIP